MPKRAKGRMGAGVEIPSALMRRRRRSRAVHAGRSQKPHAKAQRRKGRTEQMNNSERGRILLSCFALFAPWQEIPIWAGDWPQFRGPGGTAVSEEKGLPVKWSTTENVRWKAELPGRGVSSPVLAGGRVYVSAASTYRERRLHVLCFDAAKGEKLWERQFAATGGTMCHPKTSMAAPTPVTDGRHVYALFATGDLAAFTRDGDLLWYRALQRDY